MTDRNRSQNDDMDKRVRRASGGEPEAGARAESADLVEERRAASTSDSDAPDPVRDKDERAATERIERMQQEGKGMGGTSTQGRTDVADEEAIEDATRGKES